MGSVLSSFLDVFTWVLVSSLSSCPFVLAVLLFLGTVFLTVYFVSLLLITFYHPSTKQTQPGLASKIRHVQGAVAQTDDAW